MKIYKMILIEMKNVLYNIKLEEQNIKETNIQLDLHKELGGEINVYTSFGYIQLLTENQIIEIKHRKEWRKGLGNLLLFNEFFPEKKMMLYLYDIEKDEQIERFCKKYKIIVNYL